jgi:hypothetical protein
LRIHAAIRAQSEQLAKRAGANVGGREGGFVEVATGALVVVVVGEDAMERARRRKRICGLCGAARALGQDENCRRHYQDGGDDCDANDLLH